MECDFDVVEGDNTKYEVTCQEKDGTAFDLTGCTVEINWQHEGGTPETREMTVTDAPNGVAEYVFQDNELTAPRMILEVKITDAGGKILYSDCIDELNVRKKIA